MSIQKQIVGFCLLLVLTLATGCAITTGDYYLKGNKQVKQSDHFVSLGIPGTEANRFILTFTRGRSIFDSVPVDSIENLPVSVDSINGTYQYYSEAPQPIENISLEYSHPHIFTNWTPVPGAQFKAVAETIPVYTMASLVPRICIIEKPSTNTLAHAGRMKFGQYKLNIQYQLNGTNYSCHFDVNYSKDNTLQLHGIWEWGD